MWYDYFENNIFAKMIFSDCASSLDGILLAAEWKNDGYDVRLKLQTSVYTPAPPPKWGSAGVYSVVIELDFFNVNGFATAKLTDGNCRLTFSLLDELLFVEVSGGSELKFSCECGVIQKISAIK